MATWEDGPEYAPLERPSDFAVPPVAPLDIAPPVVQLALAAPRDRPRFADPATPVAPLAALVPDVKAPRDPALPFEVVAASVTSDSAWGALQPTPLALPVADPWQPPTTSAWPPPEQPFPAPGPAGAVSGFPAPGTPDWFGPGPYAPAPAPAAVTFRQVLTAATPGLCIVLLIGGLFVVLAPVMLGVAFGLSSRVTAAQQGVRKTFRTGLAALVGIAVLAAVVNETGFADWWNLVGRWALAACWVTLAVTLALIYRALKQPPPTGPGPRRATWG